MDTGILLESGTNELEILEFMIGNNRYGINVRFCHIPRLFLYQMQILPSKVFLCLVTKSSPALIWQRF